VPENKPCKLWPGAHSKAGYAQTYHDGKVWYVHRLEFLRHHGYLPKVVRHSCDNPGCWEITHLLGGTYKDNSQDMVNRGRSHGHLKLTPQDVEEITRRYLAGEKPVTIAHDFNLHKNYVYKLVGKTHPEVVRSRVGRGRWNYAQGEESRS
jgi:hypothetical protein